MILSGRTVRADLKAARVGVYDDIREDIREFSSVQPVDEVVIERTKTGWQGLLYSGRDAFLFCFDSSGFAAKPVDSAESAVMRYAYRLIDGEREATAAHRAKAAAAEQAVLNEKHNAATPLFIESMSGPAEGEAELNRFKGPKKDFINRDILSHKVVIDTLAVSPEENLAAGGVVMNSEGKILIVKPTGGYGGYDWTFPKGGLEVSEYDRFGIDGLESSPRSNPQTEALVTTSQ
jgi:hypothetical protein